MRFSTILAGLAAFAAAVVAQSDDVKFTSVPSNWVAGQNVKITYTTETPGPVTIILRKGSSNALDTVEELGTSTGGTFDYRVPATFAPGSDYALEIRKGEEVNYSQQFAITGGTAQSSAAASSSAAATSSSAPTSRSGSATTAAPTTAPTSGSNSTVTLSSTRRTPTATDDSASPTESNEPTGAPTPDAAANLRSPLALVFGAVAAMAYLG